MKRGNWLFVSSLIVLSFPQSSDAGYRAVYKSTTNLIVFGISEDEIRIDIEHDRERTETTNRLYLDGTIGRVERRVRIIRQDLHLQWIIDPDKKKYAEAVWPDSNQATSMPMPDSTASDSILPTGETRTIAGFPARKYRGSSGTGGERTIFEVWTTSEGKEFQEWMRRDPSASGLTSWQGTASQVSGFPLLIEMYYAMADSTDQAIEQLDSLARAKPDGHWSPERHMMRMVRIECVSIEKREFPRAEFERPRGFEIVPWTSIDVDRLGQP